jgi:hypothetical protein
MMGPSFKLIDSLAGFLTVADHIKGISDLKNRTLRVRQRKIMIYCGQKIVCIFLQLSLISICGTSFVPLPGPYSLRSKINCYPFLSWYGKDTTCGGKFPIFQTPFGEPNLRKMSLAVNSTDSPGLPCESPPVEEVSRDE